jgi:hypothetical protein
MKGKLHLPLLEGVKEREVGGKNQRKKRKWCRRRVDPDEQTRVKRRKRILLLKLPKNSALVKKLCNQK